MFGISGAVYVAPLCGVSKRRLDEDPLRRYCLGQCHTSNGRIAPAFDEWEQYCRETSHMEGWDDECEAYIACTFGCDVWGGNRAAITELAGDARREYLVERRSEMYATGIPQSRRCVLEKCHAYCARRVFNTCRERQFAQQCLDGNPHLYGCDVDCNGAALPRPWGPAAMLLAAAVLGNLAVPPAR